METKYDELDWCNNDEIDKQIFEEYVKDNPLYDPEERKRSEEKWAEECKQRERESLMYAPKKQQNKNTPQCPKCGSTAITAGQRGFSIITGFLGSGQTVNRCANCGYKWKPRG